MNNLITGIHGFVGSNLVAGLREKHALYGLDIVAPCTPGVVKTLSWKEFENETLSSIDVIIHLAGKAHDTKNATNAQSYFDINYGLTKLVFDKFLRSNANQFIFFSSVKAAADTVDEDFLTEDAIPDPRTPYGQSKLQAEQYILRHKVPEGKRVYILRPCMIHGPGNKGNLNLLYNVAARGIPYPLGSFHNERSFTTIENLVFILGEIIDHPIESGIYQISDDEPCSTTDVIKLIAQSLYQKPRIWNIPPLLIRALARSGDLLHLPFTTERLQKLTETYRVSNKKLKSALGLQSLPVTAHDGLLATFKSFLH